MKDQRKGPSWLDSLFAGVSVLVATVTVIAVMFGGMALFSSHHEAWGLLLWATGIVTGTALAYHWCYPSR